MTTKREHNINVRVSTEERTVIRSRAKKRGLKVSEHMRRAACGDHSDEVKAIAIRPRFAGIRRIWGGLRTRRPLVWSR